MYYYLVYLLHYLCILKVVNAQVFQDLGGQWTVKNFIKGYQLRAQVPGGIYTDLVRNKIIDDVFYGFNDIETRWVSKLDWNYSRRFLVNESLLCHNVINLVLDGVDTFSNIKVNDVEVGTTENMFVQYIFNIKPYLVLGYNNIEIQFKSAVQVALDQFNEQNTNYTVLPECVPTQYNGECHVNHIRKMQASFAWDWGPALPSMGIWKRIYIEAYNTAVLQYITVDIISNDNHNCWDVVVHTYFSNNQKNVTIYGMLEIKLYTDTEVITQLNKIAVTQDKNGDHVTINKITVPKTCVHEWWPNGYGEAHLYKLQVTYRNAESMEQHQKVLKVGFRTIELIQNVIRSGREFYFRVNGIPIFVKGSNIIPINILPELGQDEKQIRFLLQSAKYAYMNMLRVWGGGVYESDTFYQVADEMGILIWQDFMFACSMYPVGSNFLRNVQSEVRHQVRRLQHHPSIAVWAGNNENEAALRQNWYNTSSNYSIYERDYIKLYINTIKAELQKYDSTRQYLVSSPTNGIQSEKENYVAKNPQSNFFGDVHFYNYWVDGWQTSVYPTTRLTSEYGYQSLPRTSTWLSATNNTADLSSIFSEFLTKRQHHPLGNAAVKLLIEYQLNLPNESSSNFFKAFVYYSQIYQAMAVKVETEHYRQWRSSLNDAGEGYTMGALYWQLNDVWVAPSWSSIDYKNNWKMLHYFAKRFFAPVVISGNITVDRKLNVYVVSDLVRVIHNANVTVSIYRWNSFIPIKQETRSLDIMPGMSQKLQMGILNTFSNHENDELCGKNLTLCFIHLSFKHGNQQVVPDNHIFPVPLKTATLQTPNIKVVNIQEIGNSKMQFTVTIATDTISLFVWLDAGNVQGHFSDNGFLQVTQNKTIYFYAEQATCLEELTKSLTLTNLMENIYK